MYQIAFLTRLVFDEALAMIQQFGYVKYVEIINMDRGSVEKGCLFNVSP